MKVTLYAICKNEENNIDKFIKNSKLFDEVVVVDTGSIDNTVQLLRDAGIKVYEHPQTREEFDFAAARNKALSYVETEWAFSLDFNEDVEDFFPNGLDPISSEFTSMLHKRFDDVNGELKESDEVHIRFHRKDNYMWVNAVHETPVFLESETFKSESTVNTTIKITKKINKTVDKELFYFSICEREFKKDPKNWYYIWFIFNHYFKVQNFNSALEFGQNFLNTTSPYFNTFRIPVFINCSKILWSLGNQKLSANYAFHAVSESMNMGEPAISNAFLHLFELSNIIGDPNITVFASAFSDITRSSAERTRAIDRLFLSNLDDLHSCWKGHRGFADWLVKKVEPKVTVDLGVDHGFSSFVFAIPRIGHVYGIDSFEGDQYAGERNDATYTLVLDRQEKLHLKENLTFIKGYFDNVAKDWDKTIDILHIDGDHAYESVKNDYETWSKFLSEDAVILFHDTMVDTINGNEYGVKKFFEELDLPKVNFTHTFGLGVASKNKELIEFIEKNIPLDRPL